MFGSLLFTAPAATITVNSTLQSPGASGDCTLGEAILAANANGPVDGCTPGTAGGFDTIMLPAGTYNLTTVNNTNPRVGPVGLPLILSDIIIQGADAATTIIRRDPNASADFGLLALIDDPIGSLVLNDVTVRGGRGFGQAIGLQRGGGLYVGNRTVVLNRVNFDDNIATQGGAIGSFGFATVTANNCTFTNNRATNSVGGAIEARTLTVSHSTFSGNRALTDGGAINFIAGSAAIANISDSVFINNSVDVGNGGAVRLFGQVTISGSTFDGNSALGNGGTAGAIEAIGTVSISDSTITNNRARDAGGGIFTGGAVYSITRSNISNNTTLNRGGGLFITDGGATSNGTISASTISNNTAGVGVGDGGGIYVSNAKTLNFTNVTIEGNNANRDGGGIFYFDGSGTRVATLNNVTLSGNHANRDAGGLYRHDSGDIRFKNTIIALNTSSINSGHDIWATLLTSLGYNLVGIKNGANFINTTGDLTGTATAPLNPMLGPLQAHGGPTLTRMLLDGSPAIDAANPAAIGVVNACEAIDQRGVARPQSGSLSGSVICDMGAVERSAGQFEFSSSTYDVPEGGGTLTVTVKRSLSDFGTASVGYSTSDGSALAGFDYEGAFGTLVFADPSVTQQTFDVQINDDQVDEADETFKVTLSNPTGGSSLGTVNLSVATIFDNDLPSLSIADVAVDEGNTGVSIATFNVSLSSASSLPVSVDFSSSPGTATTGTDYQEVSGTLVFAVGETNKSIEVLIQGDGVRELDETLFVTLSNVTNATLARAQATGTIRNDDVAADLILSIVDFPDPVNLGDELTYSLSVLNARDLATGVVLSDTLPANVTFISATPTQGSCTQNGNTLTCNLGNIVQEDSASVLVVVRPDVSGIILTNSGSVTANETDENPADNLASQTTIVQTVADLSVSQTPSAFAVTAGDNITYSLNVHNAGPSPTSAALLSDALHRGVVFVSASTGCSHSGGTLLEGTLYGGLVTCHIDQLDVGADVQATVVVRAETAGTLSNTATVGVNGFDLDPDNNRATLSTVVNLPRAAESNGFLRIRTLVDNSGAPTPKRPEDFQLRLTAVPGGQSVSFLGSSTPTPIGIHFADNGGVFELRELNPDPAFVQTFSRNCVRGQIVLGRGADNPLDTTKQCDVTNTYVGAQEPDADTVVKVITVVDNTGSPSPRRAEDFQQRVASIDRDDTPRAGLTFAGSTAGVVVGIDVHPFSVGAQFPASPYAFFQAVAPDPDYLVTGCGVGYASDGSVFNKRFPITFQAIHTCTMTYTYIGPRLGDELTNGFLRIRTLVDNSGAPTPKRPEDFQLRLTAVPGGQSVSFLGSSTPTPIGIHFADNGGVFELRELNPDPAFVQTFSRNCVRGQIVLGRGADNPLDTTKQCDVTNTYVGAQEPDADTVVKVITVVDNTGSPSPRRAEDFQQRVASIDRDDTPRAGLTFAGSTAGVVVGIDVHPFSVGAQFPASPYAFFQAVAPDPDYLVTGCGVGYASDGSVFNKRFPITFQAIHTCTMTYTYIGPRLGDELTNGFLRIRTLVDNSGAPTPKRPEDFQLRLTAVPGGQSVSFLGSSTPTPIGIHFADNGGVFELRELNPDPAFVQTFSRNCVRGQIVLGRGADNPLDTTKQCDVTNTYVGAQEPDADTVVKVITVVDNTGSPSPRRAEDFQQRVASIDRDDTPRAGLTFAGSTAGVVVGIDVHPFSVGAQFPASPYAFFQAVAPDPDYLVTGCGVGYASDGSVFNKRFLITFQAIHTCTMTYTYIGPRGTPTSVGPNVTVPSGGVEINFGGVQIGGVTTTTNLDPNQLILPTTSSAASSGPASTGARTASQTPDAFSVFDNLAFDITTTASVSGPIKVCSEVPSVRTDTALARLKLMHLEDGSLVDRTVSRDLNTRTLCGSANSLGTFVVVQDIDSALPVISGRLTDFDGNGIGDVLMVLSGTENRIVTTTADGSYSFVNLSLGGDYSVTPGVNFAVTPASTVFNNLSANQTANFVPTPPLVAVEATLVNESCAPNGQVDPGERVTVSLKLKNNSNVGATNLMATLLSGDGVVAPSGPLSYGTILSNEISQRDFSFTAGPSLTSGQAITATLQLNDGTQNLGAVKFYFTVGASPCGGVRLVITSTPLVRSGGMITTIVSVQNTGTLPADNVVITNAMLGSATGSVSPPSLGLIDIGASRSTEVTFVTAATGASLLKINGTYGPGVGGSGTLTSTKRVTIP